MELTKDLDPYFILIAGTIAMLLLCSGALFFFLAYNRRLLTQQKMQSDLELRYKDELIHSNLQATEQERARIARDLHDDIGASLSLLRMQINHLGTEGSADAKATIDSTIDQVRGIAHALLPPALDSLGLVAALQMFCEKVKAETELQIEFCGFNEDGRINSDTKLAVYRIVQELINNTLKHAGATSLYLKIDSEYGKLIVEYQDNGKGYDLETHFNKGGMGTKNIDLRVRRLGGQLIYNHHSAGFVTVNIIIPIATS